MIYVLLIRHGEADGNREGRLIGQTKAPLSDWGRRQAEAVARRLADLPIDRIIASDLPRTMQTAEPLAGLLRQEIIREPRFREIDNGEWEGRMPDDVEAGWPDLWHRYQQGEDVLRPGGESWADVGRRSVAAAQELAEHDGRLLAVFTHGGPIIQILRWTVGIPYDTNVYTGPMGAMANTGISTFALPGPLLLSYNDVGHLAGLARHPDLPFYG